MGFKDCCTSFLVLVGKVFKKSCGNFLILIVLGFVALYVAMMHLDVHEHYTDRGKNTDLIVQYVFFYFLLLNSLFNYFGAMITDPGYITSPKVKELIEALPHYRDLSKCNRCDIKKPSQASHCSECNNCIVDLDHHCPWINNCVGYHNMRYFALFIFYTCMFQIYIIIIIIPLLTNKGDKSLRGTVVASLVMSILFVLSLLPFNCYVWENIIKDIQFIQMLKQRRNRMKEKQKQQEEHQPKNQIPEQKIQANSQTALQENEIDLEIGENKESQGNSQLNKESQKTKNTPAKINDVVYYSDKPMLVQCKYIRERAYCVFGTRSLLAVFLPACRELKHNPLVH